VHGSQRDHAGEQEESGEEVTVVGCRLPHGREKGVPFDSLRSLRAGSSTTAARPPALRMTNEMRAVRQGDRDDAQLTFPYIVAGVGVPFDSLRSLRAGSSTTAAGPPALRMTNEMTGGD